MDLPPLREVIARHGLSARKGLGQNFILDLNITRKIAPGPGGLTRAILESPATDVHVIELDPRAISVMHELKETAGARLHITEGDALEFDYAAVSSPRAVIANLPYHVASQLLISWLKQAQNFRSITIMLQKEMAQRLVAKPRTAAYGRLSVMCQWLCDVKLLFDVPASAFVPPPKVTSSIVQLLPRATAPEVEFSKMEKTVALAFSQRRKMLKGILNANGHGGEKLLAEIGASPTARAEELDIHQFVHLAKIMS